MSVLNDSAVTYLKEAVFAVEATYFEMNTVLDQFRSRGVSTVMDGGGRVTVGLVYVDGDARGQELGVLGMQSRPVCVEVHFARYKDRVILFYNGSSQVVDHGQIRTWLESKGFDGPRKRSDAQNFAHALRYIDEITTPAAETADV